MLLPSLRTFRDLSGVNRRVPVALRLPLESFPRALFRSAAFEPPAVLLESARSHPATGRYSILAGEPVLTLVSRGEEVWLSSGGRLERTRTDPVLLLESILAERRAPDLAGWPPFVGGAVACFSYDLTRRWERLPERARDDLGLPEMIVLFFDLAAVADHREETLWLIASCRAEAGEAAYEAAAADLRDFAARLTRPIEADGCPPPAARRAPPVSSTHTRAGFTAMVRQAKRFIAAGEIYQANLSQRFSFPLGPGAFAWDYYRRLTALNPSPFAAFADWEGLAGMERPLRMVCASPERFLRARGGWVETRPIAGTRPRGRTAEETSRLRRDLILNAKERAEHLMLVDLERNDLGRVCRFGSVRVDDWMALEEYSHVIHIVSNVRGELRRETGLDALLAAVFPGGTITGCPKIRSQQIIDALEPVRRHFYTGAFGYLSDSGALDLNLLIRTAFLLEGTAHIHAGAGIVADSDPEREYEETLHKARALLEAARAPERSHAELAVGP